jgi:hypothetical protein
LDVIKFTLCASNPYYILYFTAEHNWSSPESRSDKIEGNRTEAWRRAETIKNFPN